LRQRTLLTTTTSKEQALKNNSQCFEFQLNHATFDNFVGQVINFGFLNMYSKEHF
jgi:hypothetical protein